MGLWYYDVMAPPDWYNPRSRADSKAGVTSHVRTLNGYNPNKMEKRKFEFLSKKMRRGMEVVGTANGISIDTDSSEYHPHRNLHSTSHDQFLLAHNLPNFDMAVNTNSLQTADPSDLNVTDANLDPMRKVSGINQQHHFSDSFASESGGEDGENQAALEALSCAICLDTLCEPLKLGCNHLFCRVCLHFVMRTSAERKCPMCRSIIDIGDCTTQPVDEETDRAIRSLLPEKIYLERKEAARVELRVQMAETLSCLPIHVAGPDARVVQPGQRAEISFSEPNGQVLRRAMETNRLILCVDTAPAAGSWAVLVRLAIPTAPLRWPFSYACRQARAGRNADESVRGRTLAHERTHAHAAGHPGARHLRRRLRPRAGAAPPSPTTSPPPPAPR